MSPKNNDCFRSLWLVSLSVCISITGSIDPVEGQDLSLQETLRNHIELRLVNEINNRQTDLDKMQALIEFYEQRSFEPVWFQKGQLTDEARNFIDKIESIESEGLDSRYYHVSEINSYITQTNHPFGLKIRGKLPWTYCSRIPCFFFGNHFLSGRVDPVNFETD